ncbi:MAG TPA: ABC transporter ATP-binding protein [Candidatus Acidoferrales bacterium]|nr:ABC transporter ATP-binding protein [Candidatus Acidoferrales bacterium]
MSKTVIHVEGLGKRYRVGERERYLALRDVLTRAFKAPFRRGRERRTRDYLWALRDVSFGVQQGEVVGLIGRNGAGKTTLLKILSRITTPTTGSAEIHGRVGSLLEVGTGFHPELTGRENVFLSGAVLGMKNGETVRKFDEIVDFSGVERYIDTPLKHFSTGMQMRLAFAVAAHLEPEILFVDEVLAVGDLEFQKKCLGKMQEVSKSGRTIVFVSHQMNQIRRLCQCCLWIDGGKVRLSGSMLEVVSAYEASFSTLPSLTANGAGDRNHSTHFLSWRIAEAQNDLPNVLNSFGSVTFESSLAVIEDIRDGVHGIALFNSDHQLIWATSVDKLALKSGLHNLRFKLPSLPLRPGNYHWDVSIWEGGRCFDRWACVPEMIVGTKPITHPQEEWQGLLNIPWEFHAEQSGDSAIGQSGR